MDIYREIILDHCTYPRNIGIIDGVKHKSKLFNLVCGDEVEFFVKIVNGKIKEIKHRTQGCAIAMASASLLSESVVGLKVAEVKRWKFEQLLNLLGTPLTLSRKKCAEVAFDTLQKALNVC